MDDGKNQNENGDAFSDSPNVQEELNMGDEGKISEVTDWEPGPPPEDGSPPDYYTAIKLTDRSADVPLPPEYEPPKVQGIQEGGSSRDQVTGPSLAYADFLPRCVRQGTPGRKPMFDSFRSLMGFANEWLRTYHQFRVIRCESIIRKLNKDGLIEIDSTAYHQSLYGTNDYVRGLRLWLVPNQEAAIAPQQLAYLNIMPKDIPIRISYRSKMRVNNGLVMQTETYSQVSNLFPNFEDIQKTCERFNTWVRQYPLPGKMLSLESLDMVHSEFWSSRCLDPDEGFFREHGKRSKLYITMLRLFYVLGDTHYEEIGIEDFSPEMVSLAPRLDAKPRYETYTSVLQRAGTWAYNQNMQNMRFLNINTIDTPVDKNIFRRGSDKFRVNSNKSFYNDPSYSSLMIVKTIRVCYAKVKTPFQVTATPITLTSKTYVAARLGGNNVTESLSSLVYRVNAWINATGVRLLGVDTVKYEFEKANNRPVDEEKTDFTIQANRGHHFIIGLRLYIDGLYKEPPENVLPPPPPKVSSGSCNIF